MDEKENKPKKISFFKKVLISVTDFDKYSIFLSENFGKGFSYIFKLLLVFSLIITCLMMYKYVEGFNGFLDEFNKNIQTMSYENGIISINNDIKTEIDAKDLGVDIVLIYTADLTEEQSTELQNQINNYSDSTSYMILLKENIIIKNSQISENVVKGKYTDLLDGANVNSFTKEDLLNYYNANKFSIFGSMLLIMFVYLFISYFLTILLDCIVLTIATYIIARIMKLKPTFLQGFSIVVHALTLPIILNLIYISVNIFLYFNIKYFQLMYTTITFIYIITVLFMQKSDIITTRTIIMKKLEEEQEKIKEEIEKEKLKEEQEKEDIKRKDKKREEEQKEDNAKDKKNSKKNNNPEAENA